MILENFKRESLIPLPVVFISTISDDGVRNIAPYSCLMPVLRSFDLVCVASAKRGDTLVNIKIQKKTVVHNLHTCVAFFLVTYTQKFSAGEGIRTPERLREQILSLPPLTAWLLPLFRNPIM